MLLRPLVLGLILLTTACTPAMLPGTQVRDTSDNRAIIEVFQKYESAFEARDAKGIAALTSPRYLDARDGISRETLEGEMEKLLGKVKDARLHLEVRRIQVDKDHATVDYFYDSSLLLSTSDADWKRDSDDKRLELERTDDGWKVLSGL